MTLAFKSLPEGITAETLATEETFIKNVLVSIAAALSVEVDQVDASIKVVRRLEDVPAEAEAKVKPQTTSTSVKVCYIVIMKSQEQASEIESQLKDTSSRSDVADKFSLELQREEIFSGRRVVIDEVKAAEAKIDVIQDEKVDPASSSTSTTQGTSTDDTSSIPSNPDSGDGLYKSTEGNTSTSQEAASPGTTSSEATPSPLTTLGWDDEITGKATGCMPHLVLMVLVLFMG